MNRLGDDDRSASGFSPRIGPPWLRAWGPVVLMMVVIFCASSDLGRTEHTSRLVAPLVRFFVPDIGDDALASVVFVVRKAGHVAEYALLAALVWRARRLCRTGESKADWVRSALFAVGFAALYACTDEFHQSFNPHRMGQWQDVALDTAGAALGMTILLAVRHRLGAGRPAALPPSRL